MNFKSKKIAVLGGGSFGTVLANILSENNHQVCLWLRSEERAEKIQLKRENNFYLPGYTLDKKLCITADLEQALKDCEQLYIAIPSQSFRQVLVQTLSFINKETIIVSMTKGIEAGSFKLMSEIIVELLPSNPCAVISGPNLAKELAARQITGTVVASKDKKICEEVEQVLRCSYFKLFSNDDLSGVELAGVLKNIYAIMAGMASALNIGQNTISVLMTRSLIEMSRFAVSRGANPMTFMGLAGVGDLIVTCSSPLSRNFQIGVALGEGISLEEAIEKVGQVSEGVNTLKLVKEKADEEGIRMPLANSLYQILFENSDIEQEIKSLMSSELSSDVDFS